MKTLVGASVVLLLLQGCATASFAPPDVERSSRLLRVPSATCISEKDKFNNADVRINSDVIGALDLIQNFELTYRCAADEAANGRQVFEVPSFLATAAGLAGASFGLSADQILVTGVSAAVLNGGKSYYAPREKVGVLHSAIGAVNCIRTESVGISYFRTREDNAPSDPVEQFRAAYKQLEDIDLRADGLNLKKNAVADPNTRVALHGSEALHQQYASQLEGLAMMRGVVVDRLARIASAAVATGGIEVDAERQYFEMVKGALSSVHGILGERLRDAGNAGLEDVYAKLKELVKEDVKQTADLLAARANEGNAVSSFLNASQIDQSSMRAIAQRAVRESIWIENDQLQTKLQVCVLQARVV